MSECLSTNELNRDFYFKIGITEHFIEFQKKKILFYVYRPILLSSIEIINIQLPGRNGDAKEYLYQTTLLNTFNQTLSVCIEMAIFNGEEYELGNLFPESSYNSNRCLKEDAQFNPPSEWTFNIVFDVLQYMKDKLNTKDLKYILNGIDAGGFFTNYFNFFYPKIENKNKQSPLKIFVGSTSHYFFPYGKSRMKLNYIKNLDKSKTATKIYSELINYQDVNKSSQQNLLCKLNNNNILDTYYKYLNVFFSNFTQAVSKPVLNIKNQEIYNTCKYVEELIFPVGTKNLPLSESEKFFLANQCIKNKVVYLFYAEDTNIYGGVTPEGKDIPNISNSCQSEITGAFRLFRAMNSFFSTKIDGGILFDWEYVVIPCGHSSNFAANYLPLANSFNPSLWENKKFCPQYFYYIDPKLFV